MLEKNQNSSLGPLTYKFKSIFRKNRNLERIGSNFYLSCLFFTPYVKIGHVALDFI